MDTLKISFTGVIPLNRKSVKCQAAINKIARACDDHYTRVITDDVEYVFTGKDVETLYSYSMAYNENRTMIKGYFDFFNDIQKNLKKVKSSAFKKAEKPSAVEELMEDPYYSHRYDNIFMFGENFEPWENSIMKFSLDAFGVSFKPKSGKKLEKLALNEYIQNEIKAGRIEKIINDCCFELSLMAERKKNIEDNLANLFNTKNNIIYSPKQLIMDIDEGKFDCISGTFKEIKNQ